MSEEPSNNRKKCSHTETQGTQREKKTILQYCIYLECSNLSCLSPEDDPVSNSRSAPGGRQTHCGEPASPVGRGWCTPYCPPSLKKRWHRCVQMNIQLHYFVKNVSGRIFLLTKSNCCDIYSELLYKCNWLIAYTIKGWGLFLYTDGKL